MGRGKRKLTTQGELPDRDLRGLIRWRIAKYGLIIERACIRIAGDVATGVLLAKIFDCWLRKGGNLRYLERDGKLWFARDERGWSDARLGPGQFDLSIAKLEEMGSISMALFRLSGLPETYISLNATRLSQQLSSGAEIDLPGAPSRQLSLSPGMTGLTSRGPDGRRA